MNLWEEKMNKMHNVKNVFFKENIMMLQIDGKEYAIDISQVSKRLTTASLAQKQNYCVSPSGYGIHWPDVDEDLSIDGLYKAANT